MHADANPADGKKPNIVLIISDDHDNAHLGFMDHPIVHTPTLDRLAEGGTVFTTAHLPTSRCRPTLASFLSGRWPHQSGIYYNFGSKRLNPADSLPNLLKDAGYTTFVDGKFWEGDTQAMGFTHGANRDNKFVREGQARLFEFLDEVGKQPFFIWWAPRIPHTPHNAPAPLLERYEPEKIPIPAWYRGDQDAYREKEHPLLAMNSWLDDGLTQLIAQLEARKQLDNTLFVFVIDNGWSNGLVSKGSPFEKGLRTPVFLTWPGKIKAQQRFDDLISTFDLYPTILDYAGIPSPDHAVGRTLRPIIEGRNSGDLDQTREVIYGAIYPAFATRGDERPERDVYALYARTKKWKYIYYLQDVRQSRNQDYFRIQSILTDFPTRDAGDEDLYDLDADPHELDDLADEPGHRARLAEFKRQVFAWWQETGGEPLGARH
jgi:uncharacterized sulfatase